MLRDLSNRRIVLTCFLLTAIAFGCKVYDVYVPVHSYPTPFIRSTCYLLLFAFWPATIAWRVLYRRTRFYLISIGLLEFLWFVFRTVKYSFYVSVAFQRYLWYLYYVPILFIDAISLLLAVSLGKDEQYNMRKFTAPTLGTAAFLFLFVITNDLHGLVFRIPPGPDGLSTGNYSYGPLYLVIFGFRMLFVLLAVVLLFRKCLLPVNRRRFFGPIIHLLFLSALSLVNYAGIGSILGVTIDITAVSCVFITAILESCISTGLIQSNTHYEDLFRQVDAVVRITDREGNVQFETLPSSPLFDSPDPSPADEGDHVLHRMPISSGYVSWVEDVSAVRALQKQLLEQSAQLTEERDLLAAENLLKEQQTRIDVRNRLYDDAARELASRFEHIEHLMAVCPPDEESRRETLRTMCVIGVYIKRRLNMVILREEQPVVTTNILYSAFRESLRYLKQMGAFCSLRAEGEEMMSIDTVKLCYDVFETVVEALLPRPDSLLTVANADAGTQCITLRMQAASVLPVFPAELTAQVAQQGGVLSSERNEEIWSVCLTLPLGGDTTDE